MQTFPIKLLLGKLLQLAVGFPISYIVSVVCPTDLPHRRETLHCRGPESSFSRWRSHSCCSFSLVYFDFCAAHVLATLNAPTHTSISACVCSKAPRLAQTWLLFWAGISPRASSAFLAHLHFLPYKLSAKTGSHVIHILCIYYHGGLRAWLSRARCNDPIMARRGKRRFRFVAATARSANK